MSWNDRLKPSDNVVIIGSKHPQAYSDLIKSFYIKFGQCVVLVPVVRKNYDFRKGNKFITVSSDDQWKDVQRFLKFADLKITFDEKEGEYNRYLVD